MDAGLLERARLGDEVTLYQRHRTPAFRFAYRLTASAAEAEDIGGLQNSRLRFFRSGLAPNYQVRFLRENTGGRDQRGLSGDDPQSFRRAFQDDRSPRDEADAGV
jgi:hypothetical protein